MDIAADGDALGGFRRADGHIPLHHIPAGGQGVVVCTQIIRRDCRAVGGFFRSVRVQIGNVRDSIVSRRLGAFGQVQGRYGDVYTQDIAALGQNIPFGQGGLKGEVAPGGAGLHGIVIADPIAEGQRLAVCRDLGGQVLHHVLKVRGGVLRHAGHGKAAGFVQPFVRVYPRPAGDDLVGRILRLRLPGARRADIPAGLPLHRCHIAAGFVMGGMDTGGGLCHAAGFLRADVGAGVRRRFLPWVGENTVAVARRLVDMGTSRGQGKAVVAADMGAVLPRHGSHIAAFRGMGRMVLAQPFVSLRESKDRQQGKHHCRAQRQRQKPPGHLGFHPVPHKHRSFSQGIKLYTIILA